MTASVLGLEYDSVRVQALASSSSAAEPDTSHEPDRDHARYPSSHTPTAAKYTAPVNGTKWTALALPLALPLAVSLSVHVKSTASAAVKRDRSTTRKRCSPSCISVTTMKPPPADVRAGGKLSIR